MVGLPVVHLTRFTSSPSEYIAFDAWGGHHQKQYRRAHSILTTMQINESGRRYETLCINGLHVDLEFDTGPDSTIVSDEARQTLSSHKLDAIPFEVYRAPGDVMKLLGAVQH
ncbi:unnamed protein product [Hymenolepis diminuta]|uniref:Gag-pol polyprotein n=1 Tax=Hymenolepis diminuta TaxID=6216 RepID=A0A0R3SYF4_HYMDI|nr:unnamed protein product [Hymenolepis diminuta]